MGNDVNIAVSHVTLSTQRRDLPGPSLYKSIAACMGEWLPCQNRFGVVMLRCGIYNRSSYVYVSRPIYLYVYSTCRATAVSDNPSRNAVHACALS